MKKSENPILGLLKLVQELNDKYKIRHGIANIIIKGCYCDGCEKVRRQNNEFKRHGQQSIASHLH